MKVRIEVDPGASSDSDDLRSVAYETEGTTGVSSPGTPPSGVVESIGAVIVLVMVAGSALDWLSRYYSNIRARSADFVIVDLTADEPVLRVLPGSDRLKGHVLIRTPNGDSEALIPPPGPSGVADVVKQLIEE